MKKKKFEEHVIFKEDGFGMEVADSISVTEFTGLIPWGPQSHSQLESYNEVMNYSPENVPMKKEK